MRLVVEVDDYDGALRFYRDVLGATEEFQLHGEGGEKVTILDVGRATLELSNRAQVEMIDDVEVGRRVAPRLRVAFEVADVHLMAALIRERLGVKKWNSYYKFCFERDPWEKVVSSFHYRAAHGSEDRFRDFVLRGSLPTDFDRYSLRDRIAVDFVGQHATLEHDLAIALREVGIDVPVTLTREKGGLRPESSTVEAVFTSELDARVAHVFRREIAAFEYDDRSSRR